MDPSEILARQLQTYRANFLEHGDTPRGTFQTGRETMQLRYERLLRPFLPSSRPLTIHDVGCGLCDLHAYLLERGVDHEYSGSEIVPEMIAAAKEKYPEIEIFERDLFGEPVSDRYEVVVMSGCLNIPGGADPVEWKEFCLELVRRMWDLAELGISFNFLTSNRTFSDPTLFYIDPAEMLSFCLRELGRFVLLDHAIPLFEATVSVLRPDFVRHGYDPEVFGKYFAEEP